MIIKRSSMAKWFLIKTAITATASQSSAAFVPRASIIDTKRSSQISAFVRSYSFTTSNRGRSSLFESMRNGYYRNTNSDEISLDKLLEKASGVLSTSPSNAIENLNDSNRLFFSSSYDASGSKHDENMTTRGFSNWIVPGKIMVGQYPGRVPETNTPTQQEVEEHLKRVLFHRVSQGSFKEKKVCFVSLQSELPPQDDYDSWTKQDGEIYLGDPLSRMEWPNPFSHYAPVVEAVLQEEKDEEMVSVRYIHHPIQDLSVPSNSKNLRLLLWKILDFLDSGGDSESMVYIHCWGGRGRAGLTACCLLTLLEFAGGSEDGKATTTTVDVQTIFDVVQTGYASRLGSENMPPALSRSPQTDSQRIFVKKFFEEVREAAAAARFP